MRIYIALSGQNDASARGYFAGGGSDAPLSQQGWHQACRLANFIKNSNIRFDVVRRAEHCYTVQTSKAISLHCSIPAPEKRRALNERYLGGLEQKAFSVTHVIPEVDLLHTEKTTYVLRAPGIESFPRLRSRESGFLGTLKQKHEGLSILLIAPDQVALMLYSSFYQMHWQETLNSLYVGNGGLILLEKGCPEEKRILYNPDGHSAI